MTTYQIRTHNPWKLFVAMLASFTIPIWLFDGNHSTKVVEYSVVLVCVFGVMTFCYYFVSDRIEVVITDKGVNTRWTSFPFFSNFYKEVLWTDIKYWKFSQGSWVYFFSITTHDNKTLYIRCLDIYSRQEQFNLFVEKFLQEIKVYNEKDNDISNDIQVAPSIFESTFGRIFAFALGGFLVWMTYTIISNPTPKTNESFPVKVVFMYIGSLIYIGTVVFYYFLNKRKEK